MNRATWHAYRQDTGELAVVFQCAQGNYTKWLATITCLFGARWCEYRLVKQ